MGARTSLLLRCIHLPQCTIEMRILRFLIHLVFCFSCGWGLYLHSPFQLSRQIHFFQGMDCALGASVYAHPARTGGKFCAVFRPSSSFFVLPAFHVRSSSVSMFDINKILKLLIPNFFIIVLFLRLFLSFTIFWSL